MPYPTLTTKKNIVLSAAPMAWCLKVFEDPSTGDVLVSASDAATALASSLEARWLFDNVASANYKIPLSAAAASAENIDITRGDGGIIRFPKSSIIISGEDESVITDVTQDENATGSGEVTIVVNEADMEATSWTAFVASVKANKSNLWLVIVPTGFNYQKRFMDSTKKADGFVYMLSKLSNDIEQQLDGNPSTLTMTFVSYQYASSHSLYDADMLQQAFSAAFTGIQIKGTDPVITITPETLTAGASSQSQSIGEGDLVLKASS